MNDIYQKLLLQRVYREKKLSKLAKFAKHIIGQVYTWVVLFIVTTYTV